MSENKKLDENKIKEEAKKIMDKFLDSLNKVDLDNEEYELKRKNLFREEKEGENIDENFKNKFLKNAPKTSGDAILTKKGDWVE